MCSILAFLTGFFAGALIMLLAIIFCLGCAETNNESNRKYCDENEQKLNV